MPAASNIDDVIAFAATDVANVSYLGVKSLFAQTNLWIVGMFTTIFPPAANSQGNPGQRLVTDWNITTLMARDAIEGPLAGQSKLVGTCAVIDAVERAAYAVKYARLAGAITAAQQTAVVALYNATWP